MLDNVIQVAKLGLEYDDAYLTIYNSEISVFKRVDALEMGPRVERVRLCFHLGPMFLQYRP